MVKVGFIVPNMDPELSEQIRCAAQDMDINVVLGSGHFGAALDCAQQMLQDHPDIQGFVAATTPPPICASTWTSPAPTWS